MLPRLLYLPPLILSLLSCSRNEPTNKGFDVGRSDDRPDNGPADGLAHDTLNFPTQPSGVLLTATPHIRLTTIYKVNQRRTGQYFIGSNDFHSTYEDRDELNNWNQHLMPGYEAVYGYNMVNISLFDVRSNEQRSLFDRPVLVKTLYYPTFAQDTLNGQPVQREHLIITTYDEDTNQDGRIDLKDLRRAYLFDMAGNRVQALIPENCSVMRSEYDPANDRMNIFARFDANNNGQQDALEPIQIHWVDLKDPTHTGRQY